MRVVREPRASYLHPSPPRLKAVRDRHDEAKAMIILKVTRRGDSTLEAEFLLAAASPRFLTLANELSIAVLVSQLSTNDIHSSRLIYTSKSSCE